MEPADVDDPAFSHVVERWRYGNDSGLGPSTPDGTPGPSVRSASGARHGCSAL
ncbi:hypothetical protein OG258_53575 [Streptomyces mirabilis]|uniref:hypothetical protein n=1 Tax=Streptomyces mirabilis TaxID=68239 RepID=UPI002E2BB112|nr:hypothetical protein [Streptomyces mirabilis]